MNSETKSSVFAYLHNLRESGVQSVFAAAAAVADAFCMSQRDAKCAVLEWNAEVKQGEDPAEGPSNCFKA